MQVSREQFIQELKLRKIIRKGISIVLEKQEKNKKQYLTEDQKLRSIIKDILLETSVADNDPSPHNSTGINVLEDLLKKIIPVLEDDYKKLTSSEEQRTSFRSHIVNAVEKTLAPPRVTDKATPDTDQSKLVSMKEIEINVGGGVSPDDAFIDIDGDGVPDEKPDEREEFGLPGAEETGRNVAFESFKKVSQNIVDSYDVLGSTEDKELFYDYLITNLKLYFDKFESDLSPEVPEPTTPEYEQELDAEEPAGAPLPDEELDGVV
tara:strand:+ start:159 stop:950 length:792 start_codon:yes stop_codon:yes gene_type:complete